MSWHAICTIDRLTADRGVAALVDGDEVAVFLLSTGELFAVDNADPFSGAAVLARGLVGETAGVPFVASPVYKQRFDLRTGACLDAVGKEPVALLTYPVQVREGTVLVSGVPAPGDPGT